MMPSITRQKGYEDVREKSGICLLSQKSEEDPFKRDHFSFLTYNTHTHTHISQTCVMGKT